VRAALVAALVAASLPAAHAEDARPVADPALAAWNTEVVAQIRRVGKGRVTIRAAAVGAIKRQPLRVLKLVRVAPEVSDGEPAGFRFSGIRAGTIPAALGLRNGDVLDRVNGMPVRDIEEGMAAAKKISSAKRLKVRLRRKGKPVTLRVDIVK
jgi:general secretion pathway protein C